MNKTNLRKIAMFFSSKDTWKMFFEVLRLYFLNSMTPVIIRYSNIATTFWGGGGGTHTKYIHLHTPILENVKM